MPKIRRSVGWIVSTHVLTTGLAIPVVMGLAYTGLIFLGNIRDPRLALYLRATFAVMGYVGGTLYSLSYLRKSAECESWIWCTAPSIAIIAILNLLACTWDIYVVRDQGAFSIAIVAASYLVSTVAAAMLTAQGFARMTPAADEPLTGEEAPASATGFGAKFKRRLLAGGVGFAVGVAVGLAIAGWMDHGGWGMHAAWNNRLPIGLVVGGIAALLGLISGPVKL